MARRIKLQEDDFKFRSNYVFRYDFYRGLNYKKEKLYHPLEFKII